MNDIMNYENITGRTEDEGFSIRNNYKFDAMLRAIDFFSQKFNMEMLIDFAGDFINEILTLGSSALFIFDEESNKFKISKVRLYKTELTEIPNSKKLQDIATLYGTIITRNFTLFFSDDFLETYTPVLLIPLKHANKLMGFIVTSGKAIGEFTEDDFSMAKAIMNLFNDSFERNHYVEEINKKEKRLDNKIFELYTVNKASKILFSEINLDRLLTVSVEVFSEISNSQYTAFGIKDDSKNSLVLKSIFDVSKKSDVPEDFLIELVDTEYLSKDKYIFDVEREFELLKQIFKNPEKFRELQAEYVILVLKDSILGFVTLGAAKNNKRYTEEILELINSIAFSCFIALKNALLFEEVVKQKAYIEEQYNSLLKLAKIEKM